MSSPTPFAYGPSGRWLTTTHGREVLLCDGSDDHTVHVMPRAASSQSPLPTGAFSPCSPTAHLAPDERSAAPPPVWPKDVAPTAGMLVYALGLLVAAGLLGYTAIAGWYDDPFLAWMGAGILGISGISIFAASRRG